MSQSTQTKGSARRQGSPYPKAELAPRLLAKAVDLFVAGLFAWFIPSVGVAMALAYLLFADGLPNGQSPGKRLLGVKAVHVPTRRSCTPAQSLVRNLPIAIGFAFLTNVFLAMVAIPIALFELYMASSDALGVRIGDIFADTQVIDGKVPLDVRASTEDLLRRAHALGRDVGGPAEVQTRDAAP
ncbi:RDD family protein [Vulgatibacter incomptus]|uniref:RDD domain-containing protein n=1 Tax=Vulgatibacter incomptus TaxID=1391653 RepID=A0A0K1PC66_9BACT|nr:RDD family protein [Vulgatibacter incomptus]AKU91102.1 hypothetical protein AKJ08_1489 [Vulgatibacter incomptus]